jgi:hypothetical protein
MMVGGSLVLAFGLAPSAVASPRPGSLNKTPLLDAWIRIDASARASGPP